MSLGILYIGECVKWIELLGYLCWTWGLKELQDGPAGNELCYAVAVSEEGANLEFFPAEYSFTMKRISG